MEEPLELEPKSSEDVSVITEMAAASALYKAVLQSQRSLLNSSTLARSENTGKCWVSQGHIQIVTFI